MEMLLANVVRAWAIDHDQAIFVKQKEKLQGIIRYQIWNLVRGECGKISEESEVRWHLQFKVVPQFCNGH